MSTRTWNAVTVVTLATLSLLLALPSTAYAGRSNDPDPAPVVGGGGPAVPQAAPNSTHYLMLFEHTYLGGRSIRFDETTRRHNLRDYPMCFLCGSWDDQASSYLVGDWDVTLFADPNSGGAAVRLPARSRGNLTDLPISGSKSWNDVVSSYLYGSH